MLVTAMERGYVGILLLLVNASPLFGSSNPLLPTSAERCADENDCSLAGECVGGQCVCQSWTKGPNCAELNLAPVTNVTAAVQPVEQWTRWGGSVVEFDGKYHMFAAEMANKCSLGVWASKSQVIHAISDSALGPFTRLGVAIPTEAHNPVVSKAADGTWLLWTCGCPHKSSDGCSKDSFTCPGGAEPQWTTTVYSSHSLDGPWTAHVDLLGNITRGRLGSQNVSPIMRADGSVYLMFKGPDNNTEASIAYAPDWRGPYEMIAVNIFAKYYAQNITNEDCWWWQAPDGAYHMISHRMTPKDRGSPYCGGHGFTRNLTDWKYALMPAYATDVDLSNGSTAHVKRRERPQVLFSSDGTPSTLYTGVATQHGVPFTFAQSFARSAVQQYV